MAIYAADFSGFDTTKVAAPSGVYAVARGGPGTVHIVQGRAPTRVKMLVPAGTNGGYIDQAIGDHLTLQFPRAINTGLFDPSLILIEGQMGRLQATRMTEIGDTTYRINLATNLTENG